MHPNITTPFDRLSLSLHRRMLGHAMAPRRIELDATLINGVWLVPGDDMPPPAAPAAAAPRLAA